MKITKLTDVDLSKYKIAYYEGNSLSSDTLCQDDVMMFVEGGGEFNNKLLIALIPKEKSLKSCGGDDWNDSPANFNASGFYEYPKGTIFLKGSLGKELQLVEEL